MSHTLTKRMTHKFTLSAQKAEKTDIIKAAVFIFLHSMIEVS